MHNRCELAHALWEYSFQMQNSSSSNLLRTIQCLYTALDFVLLPSLEVCIRMRLAELLILHCTTTASSAALMHLQRANSLHSEVNDKKFHLLHAICNIHQQVNSDLEAFLAVGHQACSLARKIRSKEWLIFWQRKILDALFESSQRRSEAFKFLEAALDEHSITRGVHYQTLMLYKCSRLICDGSIGEAKKLLRMDFEAVSSSLWLKAVHCAVFAVEGNLQSLKLVLGRDFQALDSAKVENQSERRFQLNSQESCSSQNVFDSQSDSSHVLSSSQAPLSSSPTLSSQAPLSSSPTLSISSSVSGSLQTSSDTLVHLIRLFRGFITAHEHQSAAISLKELRESFKDLYFSSFSHPTSIFQPNKMQQHFYSLWLNASLLTESAHIPTLLQHSLEHFQGKHLDSILAKLALIMRANGQPEEASLWMQIACKRTHSSYLASLYPMLLHWNTSKEFTLTFIEDFPALKPIKLLAEGVRFLIQGHLQLHQAKYKFFEALKLANNKQCNNIHVKIVALSLLAHAYLGTDLMQAGKVVGAALQLVKEEGGEVEAMLVRIAKRVSRSG